MMGYAGATITGIAPTIFTGMGRWTMAFTFWVVGAFGSAMALVLLWNPKKKHACSKMYSNACAPACQFVGYTMVFSVV